MFSQRYPACQCTHPTVRSVNVKIASSKTLSPRTFLPPQKIPHRSLRVCNAPQANISTKFKPRQFNMSYNSRAAGAASDFGSGGKLVRPRRQASSRTPYDRPEPRPTAASPNDKSNWLSTAGRVLVNGAGKLISSVIGSDTSSSGSDWGSDDDDEVENQDGQLETESQQVIFSSESKQKIEELIMQETFSRGESDTLIQIIRSRTIDVFMLTDNQDANINNIRDAAVVEARKWIEERKKESGSQSHLDYGTCSLSSPWAPQITKEAGSPIDVARTYMQIRPPWASPTANLSEIKSPTPVKIQTLTDGSSFPSLGDVLSSQTKKREYLTSGSWSIAEEMRKLRARATNELLSTPSRKLDLSDFSFKRKANSETIHFGLKENIAGSISSTLVAVADKGNGPATEAPTSTRSTALDTPGDGPQQEHLSFVARMEMDQVAAPSSYEGGSTIPEDTNGVEGGTSTAANDLQGMPRRPEGVATEPIACSLSHEVVDANTHNEEVPDHNSQAITQIPSKHESELDGSSQPTSNEELPVEASKSSPEVLLAVQAPKKKYRVKQPVRRVRGRGK